MRFTILAMCVLGVAAAAAGCGGTKTPTAPTNPMAATVSIVAGATTLGSNAYSPNPVTIAPGGTVTWVNNDTRAHTSTADAAGGFNSGTIAAGANFSQTFPTAGTFTYHCTFHSGMVATVTVK